MLRTYFNLSTLKNHHALAIVAINIGFFVASLFYESSLGFLVTVYLIESAVIGLFIVVDLVRKIFADKSFVKGIFLTSLFAFAYNIWIFICLGFVGFLSNFITEESFTNLEAYNHGLPLTTAEGLKMLGLLIYDMFYVPLSFVFEYFHWTILGFLFIYGFEYLREYISYGKLSRLLYADLMLRGFWRLMFICYGPIFFGIVIALNMTTNNTSEETVLFYNVLSLTAISAAKMYYDLNDYYKARDKNLIRKAEDRQARFFNHQITKSNRPPLKDTFKY